MFYMRCIDFPEANTHFSKPENMTDGECYPVSAYVGKDDNGHSFINTCWVPNKEDIEAILAGRPIVLSIFASGLPPISLFTFDETGAPNE